MAKQKKQPAQPKPSTRDHLLIPDSYTVNKQTKASFAKRQPTTWVDNELTNDFGIDYHIAIGKQEGGERIPTGKVFYVQLKGDPNPKFVHNGTVLSYGVELKHLNHWYTEIEQPLYLLVVDLKTDKGYWLFMQEYLRNNEKWQRKKTGLDVQIPVSQCWDDMARWEKDIYQAITQMQTVCATLESVGKYKIDQLNLIDARFRAEARITSSGCHYGFTATEPVPINVSITSESTERHDEIFDLLNKGEQVKLGGNEVNITGSPLFQRFKSKTALLQVCNETPVWTTITVVDADEREVTQIVFTDGILSGITEHYLTIEPAGVPYRVRIGPITPEGVKDGVLGCDLSAWAGQPLRHLRQFDEVKKFYDALLEHRRARIEVSHEQGDLFGMMMNMSEGAMRNTGPTLDLIHKARVVAQAYSRQPVLDNSITQGDLPLSILATYDVITTGKHQMPPGSKYTVHGNIEKRKLEINPPDELNEEMTFYMEGGLERPFMNEPIRLGPIAYCFSKATLGLSQEEFRRQMASDSEYLDIPFVCDKDDTLELRPMTDEDRDNLREQYGS